MFKNTEMSQKHETQLSNKIVKILFPSTFKTVLPFQENKHISTITLYRFNMFNVNKMCIIGAKLGNVRFWTIK